jgi:uncharacterized protein (TIGR02231 family)
MSERNESVLEAPIARVTVLEDRAMVLRKATVPAGQGQARLVVASVSPLLVDKSLRVTTAGAKVLDVRCVRAMAPWRAGGSEPRTAEDTRAAELAQEVMVAERAFERAKVAEASAQNDLLAHQKLRRAELAELAAAAARGEPLTGAGEVLSTGDAEARALVARIADAEDEAARRAVALRDAQELAELAGKRVGEERAHLELDCLLGEGGELSLEYLVPAAAWRPFHRAHLEGEQLSWEQGACLWQRTGEDWEGVALCLSAERASLGIEPPELVDDLLDVQAKPNQVAVQAREQEIEHTGLGDAGKVAGEPQVMGIDDGGLGLVLEPPGKVTIRSDGRPHRVALHTFSSEVETALLAIPLRSPLCHVRARFANRAATPILSGPVDLVRRSGFIGRTDVDFISAGERAELGFGSEPDVRLHREQHEEQEESSLLGGWTSKTVRVVIRLSNLGAESRQVIVQDRVPVSEIEQVVITPAGPEAYLLDKHRRPGDAKVPQITARKIDEHGIVTWTVPLPPRGHAAVALEYKVKSQRGVTGI